MKYTYLFIFLLPFWACKNIDSENTTHFQSKSFSYTETTAPLFFKNLIQNHYKNFASIDNSNYETFCSENNLSTEDTIIKQQFYTFEILHKLFTSKNASNGSRGEILNIPYFWHWINPNPRYEITAINTNQKLNTVKSPTAFSKYKSYADIDRTPYLFLSELLSEKPLYTAPNCDKFSTFGWCSEREMAFVCLLKTLNVKGKVITDNNHSWSEFVIPIAIKNKTIDFKVTVDNTFDSVSWLPISKKEIVTWEKQTYKGQGNWYNEKANSEIEKQKINNLIVSGKSMENIEQAVVNYIKNHS
jgi:hypothetical protein